MYHEQHLLYEQGFSISLNDADAPLYYYFDYDTRVHNINMDFQHFHQFYEIFILLDEKASHIIEGDYYPVQQYDMVLLRPMLLHKTEYPEGPPCKRLIINFLLPKESVYLGDALGTALSVFNTELPIYRFPDAVRAELFEVLNGVFTMEKQQPPLKELQLHSRFLEFLCLLYQHRDENQYVQEPVEDSITQKIYTITSYIHNHFDQELTLESLSKRIYISPYYLSHQFKQVTGFTLVNYIQMTRVRNAQQYLLYTNLKIAEITERCGFTSFSQFNRVFHKFCHTSPSSFRANGRTGQPAEGVQGLLPD